MPHNKKSAGLVPAINYINRVKNDDFEEAALSIAEVGRRGRARSTEIALETAGINTLYGRGDKKSESTRAR